MSDYISKQSVKDIVWNGISTDTEADKEYVCGLIDSIPPVDVIEHARAIKEYCEGFPNCEGCRFYKGLPFRCTFGMCPQKWNLPKGEKGTE